MVRYKDWTENKLVNVQRKALKDLHVELLLRTASKIMKKSRLTGNKKIRKTVVFSKKLIILAFFFWGKMHHNVWHIDMTLIGLNVGWRSRHNSPHLSRLGTGTMRTLAFSGWSKGGDVGFSVLLKAPTMRRGIYSSGWTATNSIHCALASSVLYRYI